jgi:restriction endonuclease S subunit
MSATRRLGELATALRGRTPANTVSEPDGPPFFGMTEITSRGRGTKRYVSPETDLEGAVFLQEGDVVLPLMESGATPVVITAETAGAVLGRECAALRVTSRDLRPAWLSVWVASDSFKFQVAQHVAGTTMPRLPLKALQGFAITLPLLEEQLALEELAQQFDAAIAATAKTVEELEKLRAAETQLALGKRQTIREG